MIIAVEYHSGELNSLFIGINKLRQHRICYRSFIEFSWGMRKLRSINRDLYYETLYWTEKGA